MNTPAFEFTPLLSGATISLRPLTANDFEVLYAAASDPLIWEQHPFPLRYQREIFERGFFAGALASKGALIITDRSSAQVIGTSRFYDWDPEKRAVAIGFTFLARSHWGGAINRELKLLMLGHAFDRADVVWFQIGVDNLRSRRAVEKLGGVYSHNEDIIIEGTVNPHAYYQLSREHYSRVLAPNQAGRSTQDDGWELQAR